MLDEVLTVQQGKRPGDSGSHKRRNGDFANWVDAWNIFMAIWVQAFPHTALQLVMYQTIMCQLFSSYPVGVCINMTACSDRLWLGTKHVLSHGTR